MARLNQKYNVLGLPNVEYEKANSRLETIQKVLESRRLYKLGRGNEEIKQKVGVKSEKRVKELITGVNQDPNNGPYKIISGCDQD